MVDINDFKQEKTCTYKEEVYKVRDNGAVLRMTPEGKKARPLDNKWTFGKPNDKTGYMEIAGQGVHRIVAFAFHGNPPTYQHVVDHIDTNRRNNRPENLRWLTRLENALNNTITRARIENLCGSIEAFLANPSILRGHERIDPNFSWMRAVSSEEARISLERLTFWAKEHPKPQGGSLGEWVFHEQKEKPNIRENPYIRRGYDEFLKLNTISKSGIIESANNTEEDERELVKTQSLTANAVQINWKYPVEFPCCPQKYSDNPLEEYRDNLKEGKVFSKNSYGDSTVLKYAMPKSDCLWVMCSISIGWKTHAFTKISFKDGIYYHDNMGVYDIGDDPEDMFESILKGEME